MSSDLAKYPKIDYFSKIDEYKQMLYGTDIYWTVKRDGSNVGLYLNDDGILRVRSRNMPVAIFEPNVKQLRDADIIKSYLDENRHHIVFGEFLQKGISPTGIETHKEDDLFIFDIYDMETNKFISIDLTYDIMDALGVKTCPIIKTTTHNTEDSIRDEAMEVQDWCKRNNYEGSVYKVYEPDIFLKVKPVYEHLEVKKQKEKKEWADLPVIPDSEVRAIISLVKHEYGDKFYDVRFIMPIVAEKVMSEVKLLNLAPPKKKLFVYYIEVRDEV